PAFLRLTSVRRIPHTWLWSHERTRRPCRRVWPPPHLHQLARTRPKDADHLRWASRQGVGDHHDCCGCGTGSGACGSGEGTQEVGEAVSRGQPLPAHPNLAPSRVVRIEEVLLDRREELMT